MLRGPARKPYYCDVPMVSDKDECDPKRYQLRRQWHPPESSAPGSFGGKGKERMLSKRDRPVDFGCCQSMSLGMLPGSNIVHAPVQGKTDGISCSIPSAPAVFFAFACVTTALYWLCHWLRQCSRSLSASPTSQLCPFWYTRPFYVPSKSVRRS